MSLTLALSSSLSGLNLAARGTQVAADNIANAQTEAYGVRSVNQASRVTGNTGSGVSMTGITRHVDQALLNELRAVRSKDIGEDIQLAFWNRVEADLGLAGEPGGMTELVDRLESALQLASENPASPARLSQVVQSAEDIAQRFRTVHQSLAAQRDRADAALADTATRLNDGLEAVAALNDRIQRQALLGGAPEGLKDERQRIVDEISDMVSLRQIDREDGRIMLMGADGTILVDRKAAKVEFDRSFLPQANEKVEDGALGLLQINGKTIPAGSSLLATGKMGAYFNIRDLAAPEVQARVDALAENLTARFMNADIDPTLDSGEFGLFAFEDDGMASAGLTGAAGRITVNPLLANDPDASWRLRDGLGQASLPLGLVNDNALLERMRGALNVMEPLSTASAPARSVSGHASDLLSMAGTRRLIVEESKSASSAQRAALSEAFAAQGVDTDAELSRLLVLEQAYAANARVISTVDAMLRKLLEM